MFATFENRSFVTRRASMDLDQLILFGRFREGISGPGSCRDDIFGKFAQKIRGFNLQTTTVYRGMTHFFVSCFCVEFGKPWILG